MNNKLRLLICATYQFNQPNLIDSFDFPTENPTTSITCDNIDIFKITSITQ